MNIDDLPKHKCGLSISHNEHRNYYEKIDAYIASLGDDCFKDEQAKQRAIATNEIWEMQWFPRTPVASFRICAPTLNELIEFAQEVEKVDEQVKP